MPPARTDDFICLLSAMSAHLVLQDPVPAAGEVAPDPARLALVVDAEDLNGDERRERNEGDAAERLRHDRRGIEHAACADGERQDECGDHRAARDAARVERNARKQRRREEGQHKRDDVAGNEDPHDIDAREDTRHGESQGDTDADAQPLHHGGRADRARAHALDLLVEDVHGGLRCDDEVADDHADGNEQPAAPQGGKPLPDRPADGHKADVCAR